MSLYNNNQSYTSASNYPRQASDIAQVGTTGTHPTSVGTSKGFTTDTASGYPSQTAVGNAAYPPHTVHHVSSDYGQTTAAGLPHTSVTAPPYGGTASAVHPHDTASGPGVLEKTKEILTGAKDFAVEKAHIVGEKIEEAVHQHRHCKNPQAHHPHLYQRCKNPSAHHGAAATAAAAANVSHSKPVATTVADTNKAREVAVGSSHDQYPTDNRSITAKIADKVTGTDSTASASHQQYPHQQQFPLHDDRNLGEKIADKVRGTDTAHQAYPPSQNTTAVDSLASKQEYTQHQRGTGMMDTKIHGQAH